jgi:hypothetical protein
MPPRLRQMLEDLKNMKREFSMAKDASGKYIQEDPNLDDFGRLKLNLTKLCAEVRGDVDRLNEMRSNAPDGRDLNSIKLANDNFKSLKKAGEMWKELREMVIRQQKDKKADEKQITDRQRIVTNFAEEIKELGNKNSAVKMEKTSVQKDTENRKAERAKRNRDAARAAKAKKERKRRGDTGDAGDDDKGGDGGDDIEMRPTGPASAEEQQFMQEYQQNLDVQNQMLDEILKGVNELHELAKALGVSINVGAAMIDELDTKMTKTIETFKSSNKRLQEILDESGGMSRWCPMLICFIILFALVMYMIKIV